MTLQNFSRIDQCLQDSTFPCAVGPEQKRDRPEFDPGWIANPFEVFECERFKDQLINTPNGIVPRPSSPVVGQMRLGTDYRQVTAAILCGLKTG